VTQKHVAVGGRTLADRSLYEPDIEARLEKNLYRFSPYKDWVTAISSLSFLFNCTRSKNLHKSSYAKRFPASNSHLQSINRTSFPKKPYPPY